MVVRAKKNPLDTDTRLLFVYELMNSNCTPF